MEVLDVIHAENIAKGIDLYSGDCLQVLPQLAENSVDSCVCDPPYHLTSIVKRFGAEDAAPAKEGKTGAYARASRGFMGKVWDGGEIAFEPETWAEVYRVLKPGGHLLAFGAPKNFGFMQYAISQAGFEVRDVIAWIFGSGFPKSHNIGDGWGTALKPAYEPIILARKPLSESTIAANAVRWGVGALNIDGCRVETDESLGGGAYVGSAPHTEGWGFKNGQAGEFKQPTGRWPANIIHDGSAEVVEAFPDTMAGGQVRGTEKSESTADVYGDYQQRSTVRHPDGFGSAARFFYTAKADQDDRLGSKHPTVKPVDLMQYLVRLVTPKNGLVLDPFSGTGTTGEAAFREGMRAVLIERESEYQDDIRRRMKLALAGPDERQVAIVKAKGLTEAPGPLFADIWKEPYWNEDGTVRTPPREMIKRTT